MPRGDKSKYTDRQAAERRAWATVNKDDGGGKAGGSGRGAHIGHPATHRRNAERHGHT